MSNSNSYTIEFIFYFIAFVIEVLIIHFFIGVESWISSIVLAATVGSLCTWGISNIPDILD